MQKEEERAREGTVGSLCEIRGTWTVKSNDCYSLSVMNNPLMMILLLKQHWQDSFFIVVCGKPSEFLGSFCELNVPGEVVKEKTFMKARCV